MQRLLLASAAAMALAAGGTAQAAPAWTFTGTTINFSNGDWNFVNNFRVINAVTVSGLGYYADPTTGAVDDNQVSLFSCDAAACDTTGTLLASVVVTNAFPVTNFFRFVTIPAIVLAPGTYQVAGLSRGDNYTWDTVGFATDPNIEYLANSWQLTSAAQPLFLNFLQNDVTDGYWGPNVFLGQPTFSDVPEPASLALLGMGLFGLAGLRRRKAA